MCRSEGKEVVASGFLAQVRLNEQCYELARDRV